jgi:poly-gamma-glutamate capsule biosynthesis protein CapA/YwtB (metallophosphatase superfamily)
MNSSIHFRILSRLILWPALLLGSGAALAQDKACSQASSSTESVRLVFGGDIVLGNSFAVKQIPKDWEEQYFAGVRSTLQSADVVIGNLEGTLTNQDRTSKKPGTGRQFAFRSPPHYAQLLKREGFTVLNLANNHAFDFGDGGFLDTQRNLQRAGVAVTGLREETTKLTLRGLNLAVLGFTYSNRFNSVLELEEGASLVQQAKASGAFVIVTFHAGAEGAAAVWHEDRVETFMGENRGNTVAFSRAMIDAGADLVVGHGPHVLRAAECYQGRPIVYSLGNFVGVGGLSIKNMASVSALLEVAVAIDGTVQQMKLVPLRFNEQRIPEPDPQELGTRLVNYLGKNARYPGKFIEFAVSANDSNEFAQWFSENLPRDVFLPK